MAKGLIPILFLLFINNASGQLSIDLESGSVFTGYNKFRIPGNGGTLLPVQEHLKQGFNAFVRGRGSFSPGKGRHTVSMLAAPLKLQYKGLAPYEIQFENAVFAGGQDLTVDYRFDSYRLTYRYNFIQMEKLVLGAGITAKVRDASIRLASGNTVQENTNLGLVPLIHFKMFWLPHDKIALTLDGDALAAPAGRAEDLALFLNYLAFRDFWLKAGYRLLEGGADNSNVYTFSLFHYAALGANINW